ncbi:MAG: hypothetical protein JNL10_15195 [Verrucomicrobiales bacterium]|nr:hypothetical protein [Verrucomicrobiales bacterium]
MTPTPKSSRWTESPGRGWRHPGRSQFLLLAMTLGAGPLHAASSADPAGGFASNVENEWFRAWPPASVSYSFPTAVRQDGVDLGELGTTILHATYIQSVEHSDHFRWLLGGQWQRVQSGVPSGVPIPETLQSAAAVVGFDWFFHEGWRARLEVFPGIYSDFQDVGGEDLNAPFTVEVSYALGPDLLLGGQLNVNGRREAPVLGAVGVRWRFAEDWLLSLWFPRPRLEYFPAEGVTLFASANIVAGAYVVAEDFGRDPGHSDLGGQTVDFRQVQVGGGLRYNLRQKLAIELSGGWTLEQRYDFYDRGLDFESGGTPYVQIGFGLTF